MDSIYRFDLLMPPSPADYKKKEGAIWRANVRFATGKVKPIHRAADLFILACQPKDVDLSAEHIINVLVEALRDCGILDENCKVSSIKLCRKFDERERCKKMIERLSVTVKSESRPWF